MPGCPRSVKLAREQRDRVLPSHSWRGRGVEASRVLWSALVRAEAESDLEFVCGDGTSVLCDQLVLALASTFLHKLILANCVRTGDDRLRPQRLTVCLPDVSSEAVRGLLSGYKEMALHEAADHGLWERITAEDERPEVRRLVQQITKPR